MFRIAFISRSTLKKARGGDTVQIEKTAESLRTAGQQVDILSSADKIRYAHYDLFHFFNLNRPADLLSHLRFINQPLFISPIFVDYTEYDKHYRSGISGLILKKFSGPANEYIKTVSRWLKGTDNIPPSDYLRAGHEKSIKKILEKTTALLPNSESEKQRLQQQFGVGTPSFVIPNGIDTKVFHPVDDTSKDDSLVLCVARIEGIKNQYNLVKALNNTNYRLLLIGSFAPNQYSYYKACREIAGNNIEFKDRMPQEELVHYYRSAKVHVLPSWFETCGLSSLEAASMGTNIVITEKGFTRDYFGNDAFYCDPGNPTSIREEIDMAAGAAPPRQLQERIFREYTWDIAASKTLDVYKQYLDR